MEEMSSNASTSPKPRVVNATNPEETKDAPKMARQKKQISENFAKQKEAISWYTKKNLTGMVKEIQEALIRNGYNVGEK